MRNASLLLLALVSACTRPLLVAEPRQQPNQETLYANGTPIVVSHGKSFDIAVQPRTTATGRYAMDDKLGVLVAVYNRSGRRVEVSEGSFAAQANGQPIHLVSAVEMEDQINSDAAWSQAFNMFSGALAGASSAASGMPIWTAQKEAAKEVSDRSTKIEDRRVASVAQLHTVLQRNTVDPDHGVSGALVFNLQRLNACPIEDRPATPAEPGVRLAEPARFVPGPCRITVVATVEGETHAIEWSERAGR